MNRIINLNRKIYQSFIYINMGVLVIVISFGYFVSLSEGSVTINVPNAGNCAEDTVLTCHVTGSIGNIAWLLSSGYLTNNGIPVRPEDVDKYTETRGATSFTLTIHNTSFTDEGYYQCQRIFYRSQLVHLNIQCKASAAVLTVTNGKKVVITVDKLYPSSPTVNASFAKENSVVAVPGSWTCSSSTLYLSYYTCVWTSNNSLADGLYNYSLIVTTRTQADPLTGSFKIVSPQNPTISNVVKLEDNRKVVYGNEGQSLTIQCTSIGGYPAPKTLWYINSVSTSFTLDGTSTETLQGDGTYTVTLQHTFTPAASDDRKTLICRSYYPEADSAHIDSKNKRVILYLTLKPSQPTVTQTEVSAGNTVEVSCRTTGGRPAANISWSYQGSTTTEEVNATLDTATETYTVVSVFRRQVTAADNGRNVQCVVTHPALVSPSEISASVNLNIRFKPLTTAITGNSNIIANGKNTLPLVCTSGSSKPISDITWRINNVITPHTGRISYQSGDYGGMKRQQRLTLTPTRDNDGDIISCEAKNSIGTSDRSKVTLDLRYSPLIDAIEDIIAVEGNNTVLTCAASSKPASTFKWYKQGHTSILHQGTGTFNSNKLTYTINNARRSHAALYRCNANNGIETADNENVLLTVYYPPDVIAVTGNATVKAATASITCNAKGVPNTDYEYGKWRQTWPGSNVLVSEKPGSERLVLTHLTYEHSGIYTCSVSNGIKVFGSNKEFMEGSVFLLVTSYPIIAQLSEKPPGRLKEISTVEIYYYSNVAGSEMKIYRSGTGARQAGVMYTVSEDHVEVDLPVFSHIVKTDGTRARILIQIQSKEDFGFYDVVVSNEIDSTTRTFEIVPIGPPAGPFNITVDNIRPNTARLSWTRSFHGGFAQTFLIQLSTDRTNWRNEDTVYGGTDESEGRMHKVLTNLKESTSYHIRMYAFNIEGNSPFSESHNFTTLSSLEVPAGSSAAVTVGVVGGAISALIVIVVIVIITILVRRGIITKADTLQSITINNQRQFCLLAVDDPWIAKCSLRTRIETAIICVGKKPKQPSEMEIQDQDSSIRMYEQIQHTPNSGQTNVYDALKVDHEKHTKKSTGKATFQERSLPKAEPRALPARHKSQYENLPQRVSTAPPTYMNISAGKLNKNVNQTYEKLKLQSEMTGQE